jgi:hypothetical protein
MGVNEFEWVVVDELVREGDRVAVGHLYDHGRLSCTRIALSGFMARISMGESLTQPSYHFCTTSALFVTHSALRLSLPASRCILY